MTADQVIALFASIGACLSAGATFWTVREMHKQRLASSMPQVLLAQARFELKSPFEESSDDGGEVWAGESRDLMLPVYNLGVGAATACRVVWSFNVETLIGRVNQLAQKTLTQVYFSCMSGMIMVDSIVMPKGASMWHNQRNDSLEYVLPVSVQAAPVMLRVPHAYILLLRAYVFLAFKAEDPTLGGPFTLEVSLEYKDISGIGRKSSFHVEVDWLYVSSKTAAGYLRPVGSHENPITFAFSRFRGKQIYRQ